MGGGHHGPDVGPRVTTRTHSQPADDSGQPPHEFVVDPGIDEQAGLSLENVALRADLLAQLADVRVSRARIVAAGDAERRRVERNLHRCRSRCSPSPGSGWPPDLETAAYYVVAEALTNTVKHAGASAATVRVELREGCLYVDVTDDGRGGADPDGPGLQGLADRLAALGNSSAATNLAARWSNCRRHSC